MATLTITATTAPTPTFPAAGRATFASLPSELIDLIIAHAINQERLSIRRERYLQNYALVHPAFVAACQRRLLRRPRVSSIAQARRFLRLVQGNNRMAGYVRELHVVGEHMNETGVMDALKGLGDVCLMLSVLSLREVGLNTVHHASLLPRLTHLSLTSVTLSLSPATCSFPNLTQLTLSNVALLHISSPPSFPNLHNLSYSNTLPSPYTFSADPLFFSSPSLTSLGSQLRSLQIARLFSPTHYLSSRKSPTLATGHPLPPRTPAADIEPSLENFSALTELTLLADSSHQAGAYFPLLDSLPKEPSRQLKRFEVRVELGCRDKVQEVDGICEELMDRFFGGGDPGLDSKDELSWRWEGVEGKGKASAEVEFEVDEEGKKMKQGLEKLILPGVFHQLAGLEGMKELRKCAEAGEVEIQFVL